MATFELLDGDHINYEEFVALQKEAFADILAEMKTTDEFMVPDYYRWKYHAPSGHALIAVGLEGGHMVSTLSMTPLEIRYKQNSVLAWRASDAATLPKARGKGYFLRCGQTLDEALKPNEIFYAFPNKNSIPMFLKLGWQEKGIVTTWVNPLTFLRKRASPNINEIAGFGEDQDRLAERLTDQGKAMIFRSADYLNWRYTHHPLYKYTSFIYRKGDEQTGYAVTRICDVYDMHVVMIMDLAGLEPRVELALLQYVAHWAHKQGLMKMVLLGTRQQSQSLILTRR